MSSKARCPTPPVPRRSNHRRRGRPALDFPQAGSRRLRAHRRHDPRRLHVMERRGAGSTLGRPQWRKRHAERVLISAHIDSGRQHRAFGFPRLVDRRRHLHHCGESPATQETQRHAHRRNRQRPKHHQLHQRTTWIYRTAQPDPGIAWTTPGGDMETPVADDVPGYTDTTANLPLSFSTSAAFVTAAQAAVLAGTPLDLALLSPLTESTRPMDSPASPRTTITTPASARGSTSRLPEISRRR